MTNSGKCSWIRISRSLLRPRSPSATFFFCGLHREETDAEKLVQFATSTVKTAEGELLEAQSTSLSKKIFSRVEPKLSMARSDLAAAEQGFSHSERRYKLAMEDPQHNSRCSTDHERVSGCRQSHRVQYWILYMQFNIRAFPPSSSIRYGVGLALASSAILSH